MDFLISLSQEFKTSPISMSILALLQWIAVGIIAERSYFLFKKRTLDQKEHSKDIGIEVKNGNFKKALDLCQSQNGPLGKVAFVGITEAINSGTKESIQEKMDQILLDEQFLCQKRIGLLAMIANLATFTGLIGTVHGLIQSFAAIKMNPEQKEKLLSEAISLAMNSTAYGLLVAVPCLIMYAVLQNRSTRLTDDLNKGALNIFIQLGYQFDPKNPSTRLDNNVETQRPVETRIRSINN